MSSLLYDLAQILLFCLVILGLTRPLGSICSAYLKASGNLYHGCLDLSSERSSACAVSIHSESTLGNSTHWHCLCLAGSEYWLRMRSSGSNIYYHSTRST